MEEQHKGTVVAVVLIAVIVMAIISPLLFIWALNTLFALNIAFGFWEWLAALLLLGLVSTPRLKHG